jgi:hypothetical protein
MMRAERGRVMRHVAAYLGEHGGEAGTEFFNSPEN